MTENEAKTKWCPMTRYRTVKSSKLHQDTVGMSNLPTGTGKCIGSDCMAWRWKPREVPLNEKYHEGYCGLAGKL